MATKLDPKTTTTVIAAWKSLVSRAKPTPDSEIMDWSDHEQETGFLKNIDALTALVDPFLLSPTSFIEPTLPAATIYRQAELLFDTLDSSYSSTRKRENIPFAGFSAAPYPYVDVAGVDYVDSAAAVLNLACAIADLAEVRRESSYDAEEAVQRAASSATTFLLDSKIEDKQGVRWLGIRSTADNHSKYANLFFTKLAAISLHRAVNNRRISTKFPPQQIEQIHNIIPAVCKWTMGQFDDRNHFFWMDVSRAMGQPIATLYALEIMYTIMDELVESAWREDCAKALHSLVQRMPSVKDAAALQMDVFHTLPLPGLAGGTAFYDDRGYVGAILSLLATAKSVDPELVTDQFVRAGEELFRGVSDEWIDEPTDLWDDGRPLICYSRDALIGVVRHALEGVVPRLLLREDEIRAAVRDALVSSDVIDAVSAAVLEKARRIEETAPLIPQG